MRFVRQDWQQVVGTGPRRRYGREVRPTNTFDGRTPKPDSELSGSTACASFERVLGNSLVDWMILANPKKRELRPGSLEGGLRCEPPCRLPVHCLPTCQVYARQLALFMAKLSFQSSPSQPMRDIWRASAAGPTLFGE